MNKRKTIIVILVIILIAAFFIAGAIIFDFINRQSEFRGNRVKNPDAYVLDIERMNGADTHTLNLKKGDRLQVKFETVKGQMRMDITAPDGTVIYSGDGTALTEFSIDIDKDGKYVISVNAGQAKGTVHIEAK